MNIINRLLSQLSKIQSILIKEIESGSYTLNYNVCETEFKFLDKYELQKFLTNTEIKNPVFLKIINGVCLFIIDAWQKELQSIPYKELQGDLVVEGDFLSIATKVDFHAFLVKEKGMTACNKIAFVKSYDYTLFDLSDIAARCNWILNFNTAAYPETIPDKLIIGKVDKVDKVKKTLNDFFVNIDEGRKEDFYKELGNMFLTEKGRSIKAVIEIFKENAVLIIPPREFKVFYLLLKSKLDRDIGEYQSINDKPFNEFDNMFLDSFIIKLNPLINRYKAN
jgi:hypothetical protein